MKKVIWILIAISLIMTSSIFSQTKGSGELMAYYPFNGNSNDESGNSNHGTNHGAMLALDRFANANSAYYFDGIDDYIEVQHSSSLIPNGDQITMSAWVFPTQYNTNDYIINKAEYYGSPVSYFGYCLRLLDRKVGASFGGHNLQVYSVNTVPINEWTLITVTYENNNYKIYINDQLDSYGTHPHNFNSTCKLQISRHPMFNAGYWDGRIDEIKIFDYALSYEEIQNLYNPIDPPIVDLGPNQVICQDDIVMLDAENQGSSYLWSTGDTSQIINVTTSGSYWVIVTNEGGADTDSVDVTFNMLPTVNAGSDVAICEGQVCSLQGVALNFSTAFWTTSGDGTFEDVSSLETVYFPGMSDISNQSVVLTLVCEAEAPCLGIYSNDVVLTINSLPLANAGIDETIYIGYPPYNTQLNAYGGITYSWSPAAGLSNPNIPNPMAEPEESIVYTVMVTDSNGCSTTDDVYVEVIDVRCGINMDNILICHIPSGNPNNAKTKCVSYNAVEAHLAHGDYLGTCNNRNYTTIEDNEENLIINISPNPFQDYTKLKVNLLEEAKIEIIVYDVSGKKINTIQSGQLCQGIYTFTWDGRNDKGSYVPDGLYLLEIIQNNNPVHYKLLKK